MKAYLTDKAVLVIEAETVTEGLALRFWAIEHENQHHEGLLVDYSLKNNNEKDTRP